MNEKYNEHLSDFLFDAFYRNVVRDCSLSVVVGGIGATIAISVALALGMEAMSETAAAPSANESAIIASCPTLALNQK